MAETRKYFAHLLLFPLGLAFFFMKPLFQEGTVLSIQMQPTPTLTPSAFERLAPPTLPPSPAQADDGAYSYWLLCLPCHGDRGQGLTDEFRTTYPPDEQNCWKRGCHGARPYEDGFKLPTQVPAIIGSNAALEKFPTAARLQAYILAAMPYWNPGSLTEQESWQITAFLLRENNIPFSGELNTSSAEQVSLMPDRLLIAETPDTAIEDTRYLSRAGVGALVVILLTAFVTLLLRKRRGD